MSGPKPKDITYTVAENGCHICTSHAPGKNGYYRINIKGEVMGLHRYVYLKNFGEIKKGNVVRHTCDNTICINPKHLIEGTQADNNKDKANRNRCKQGIDHHNSKLTEKEVLEIFNSTDSQANLAEKYDVNSGTIFNIIIGKTWRHITQPS